MWRPVSAHFACLLFFTGTGCYLVVAKFVSLVYNKSVNNLNVSAIIAAKHALFCKEYRIRKDMPYDHLEKPEHAGCV